MSAELRFGTLAGLVAGMSVATAAFNEPLPPWMPIPLVALAAWRLVPAWRGVAPAHLAQSWKLLALVTLTLLLWSGGRLGLGINGAGALFIVLLWSKLLELQDLRDLHATCAIALFVVAAQLLVSQSLAQCLVALLASVILLSVLVHTYVVGLAEDGKAAAPTGARLPFAQWWRALRLTSIIGLQAAPFGLMLFLCLPRPGMSPGLDTRMQTSGIGDQLNPGSIADLALNRSVAFRVAFLGSARPEPSTCYWRGLMLWNTDGQQWWGRRGRSSQSATTEPRESEVIKPQHQPTIDYEITMEPTNRQFVFTLDCPDHVFAANGSDATYQETLGQIWQSKDNIGSIRNYRAGSRAVAAADPAHPVWRTSIFGQLSELVEVPDYTRLPADLDPRFIKLADELGRQCTVRDGQDLRGRDFEHVDADKAIRTTLAWFRRNNFRYTLHPGTMASISGTFLFEKRRGFCEHFAAAFSLLMRHMGLPARVMVGYLGGEWNPVGNYVTVRQSNAHAWSEVFVPGEGWRRVDPTSAVVAEDDDGNLLPQGVGGDTGALLGASGNSWIAAHLHGLSQRWDYLEAEWDRWALAYDQDAMATLEHALRIDRLGMLAPVVMFLAPCTPLALLLIFVLRRRRALGDPALQAYRRLCDRLALAGVPRHPDEGPLDFARRAGLTFPEQAAEIVDTANRYARLRYGPPLDPQRRGREVAALRRQVGALRPRQASARR